MATISELRTGLANNLATINGLRTAATIPEDPKPPVAIVTPVSVQYDTSFGRGSDEFQFSVVVLASRIDARSAQDTLDAYCSSTGSLSIKAAIESDKTLGGKAFSLRVTDLRSYSSTTVGDITYLAAEFAVTVIGI